MANKTLTKADIVDEIYQTADKGRGEAQKVVDSLLLIMRQAIKKDHVLLKI